MIAATGEWDTARELTLREDALLFALVDELRRCEKDRDLLLERLGTEDGEPIEAAAKKACDRARVLYRRIAAVRPTTAAGVLRQLELAADGWVAPSAVPTAMAALREIARQPPPLKVGKLPPVPPPNGTASQASSSA